MSHGKKRPRFTSDDVRPVKALFSEEMIYQEYVRLYKTVKSELEQANAEHKKLVILAGEFHCDRNAMLSELMLCDICHRLGIDDVLMEMDEAKLKKSSEITVDQKRTRYELAKTAEARHEEIIRTKKVEHGLEKEDADHLRDFLMRAMLIGTFKNIPIALDGNQNHAYPNVQLAGVYSHDFNASFHPFDPLHTRCDEDEELQYSNKRETPMVDCIKAVAKSSHAFGMCGSAHLPALLKALQEKQVKILPLDFTMGRDASTAVDRERSEARLEELQALDIYKAPFKSDYQMAPADVLGLMLKASLKHRKKCGETNKAFTDAATEIVDLFMRFPQKTTDSRSPA